MTECLLKIVIFATIFLFNKNVSCSKTKLCNKSHLNKVHTQRCVIVMVSSQLPNHDFNWNCEFYFWYLDNEKHFFCFYLNFIKIVQKLGKFFFTFILFIMFTKKQVQDAVQLKKPAFNVSYCLILLCFKLI